MGEAGLRGGHHDHWHGWVGWLWWTTAGVPSSDERYGRRRKHRPTRTRTSSWESPPLVSLVLTSRIMRVASTTPVPGVTSVPIGQWHHIAATYDGQTWKLYLDGVLDKTLTLASPFTPEYGSIQHAALAAGLSTLGAPGAGFFSGTIDEARVWGVVRTQQEIAEGMVMELTSGTGLKGRWGLNEGSGTTAGNSVAGSPSGTLTNGPTWTPGSPFAPQTYTSFQEAVNGYAGTVDTHIRQVAPDATNGSATTIEWDSDESGANTQKFGLLRFDNVFGSGVGQVLLWAPPSGRHQFNTTSRTWGQQQISMR